MSRTLLLTAGLFLAFAAPVAGKPRPRPSASPSGHVPVGPPAPVDQTVARLAVAPTAGATNVDLWVTRMDSADGSVLLKVVSRGVGPKPQAVVLYEGGGGDDGPGVEEFGSVVAKPFELPDGRRLVRVDFTAAVPGTRRGEEETETTLVAIDAAKTRKVLELKTRGEWDKSKVCREGSETQLQAQASPAGVEIVAVTQRRAVPALGDDDLPIDPKCKAGKGGDRVVYREAGGKFVQVDPPLPSPSASPASSTSATSSADD